MQKPECRRLKSCPPDQVYFEIGKIQVYFLHLELQIEAFRLFEFERFAIELIETS
jgi:hypothetical protein